MTIENPVITIPPHIELDVCSITAGNLGLCHQESGSDFAVQQWAQPLLLLLLGAVLCEHLHVAGVWGGTVGGFTGGDTFTQQLSHQAVLEIAEASTLLEVVLGQEHVPKPKFSGLDFEILDHLWVCVKAGDCSFADLLRVDGICWDTFFLDEFLNLFEGN